MIAVGKGSNLTPFLPRTRADRPSLAGSSPPTRPSAPLASHQPHEPHARGLAALTRPGGYGYVAGDNQLDSQYQLSGSLALMKRATA